MKNITIRLETKNDYRAVEELTREAFWNIYKPGADEHYYVHKMRSHPDFIPELAFVLVPNCCYRMGCPEFTMCKEKHFVQFLKYIHDKNYSSNGLTSIRTRYELYNKMFEEEI